VQTVTGHPYEFDVFLCHASEDKEDVVRPLARLLDDMGIRVWVDEVEILIGDRLRQVIDRGIAKSRYGVVIISPSFFAKTWPKAELDGLFGREMREAGVVVLPVWHQVDHGEVLRQSPTIAGKLASETRNGLDRVAADIARRVANHNLTTSIAPASAVTESSHQPPSRSRVSDLEALIDEGIALLDAMQRGELSDPRIDNGPDVQRWLDQSEDDVRASLSVGDSVKMRSYRPQPPFLVPGISEKNTPLYETASNRVAWLRDRIQQLDQENASRPTIDRREELRTLITKSRDRGAQINRMPNIDDVLVEHGPWQRDTFRLLDDSLADAMQAQHFMRPGRQLSGYAPTVGLGHRIAEQIVALNLILNRLNHLEMKGR
jgi:hypothetical protein